MCLERVAILLSLNFTKHGTAEYKDGIEYLPQENTFTMLIISLSGKRERERERERERKALM